MFKLWRQLNSLLQNVQTFVIFHFAVVKRNISNNYGTKYPILIDISASLLTTWFLPFSLFILITCGIYKIIVYVYLTMRYGRHFHGMITGMDMLTILAPGCDGSIHGLTRCSTDKPYNGQQVYNKVCTQINEKFYLNQVDRKFFSTREYCSLGYHYFKETFGVKVDDIVKCIKAPNRQETDSINEDELMHLAKTYYNSDLPVNNKFNWDICVCLNPIAPEGKAESEKTTFVIFTRMHHTLGDGLVIYNILVNNLFQFGPHFKTYAENLVDKCKNLEKRKKRANHVCMFARKILVEKPCILRDGKGHVRTIFTNRVEAPSSFSYLDKAHVIRKKFPGMLTFNIFMTAYSASLAEYYTKYSRPRDIPETIETTHPVQLDLKRYLDIYSSAGRIKLSNEVSSFQFICPVIPRTKRGIPIEDYLIERMLQIKDSFDRPLNSMDIQAGYIWSSMFYGVLPYQLTSNLFHDMYINTLTTCMPGGPTLKLFNNDDVDSITYFLPRQYYATLAIAINTYDRRLQLGITANQDKIETLSKLNEIRDGFFKYLDLLYDQCLKLDS